MPDSEDLSDWTLTALLQGLRAWSSVQEPHELPPRQVLWAEVHNRTWVSALARVLLHARKHPPPLQELTPEEALIEAFVDFAADVNAADGPVFPSSEETASLLLAHSAIRELNTTTRRVRRRQDVSLPEWIASLSRHEATQEDEIVAADLLATWKKFVGTNLGETHAKCLELRAKDWKVREIAAALEISPATAARYLEEAVNLLRLHFEISEIGGEGSDERG